MARAKAQSRLSTPVTSLATAGLGQCGFCLGLCNPTAAPEQFKHLQCYYALASFYSWNGSIPSFYRSSTRKIIRNAQDSASHHPCLASMYCIQCSIRKFCESSLALSATLDEASRLPLSAFVLPLPWRRSACFSPAAEPVSTMRHSTRLTYWIWHCTDTHIDNRILEEG